MMSQFDFRNGISMHRSIFKYQDQKTKEILGEHWKGLSSPDLSVQALLSHPLPFSTSCGNKHSRESQWKENYRKSKTNSQHQQPTAQMLACFHLRSFN